MDLSSEFADEYQDWLEGHPGSLPAPWFDVSVAQLERHPLLVVRPDAPVRAAIELMSAHDHGAVLVVDAELLRGIFTERDVLHRVGKFDLDRTPVAELMTACPEVLPEWATLAQALRTMARARYRHLPVVDESGRPTAIVSTRRIVQFVCETFPEEILNAPPLQRPAEQALEGA